MPELTIKQEKFVNGYLEEGNGTKAAILAGYSPKTAYSIASENLRKPEIEQAIEQKKAELSQKVDWTMERSAREAEAEFQRLRQERPDTAYKYKENLDKLHGLLVDRSQVETTDKVTQDEINRRAAELALTMLQDATKSSEDAITRVNEAEPELDKGGLSDGQGEEVSPDGE